LNAFALPPVMLAWPPLCLLEAQESVKPVPARSRFITEAQWLPPRASRLTTLRNTSARLTVNPELPYLAQTSSLGYRNSNCRLVHIESNVRDRTHLARLPCGRLRAGLPAPSSY